VFFGITLIVFAIIGGLRVSNQDLLTRELKSIKEESIILKNIISDLNYSGILDSTQSYDQFLTDFFSSQNLGYPDLAPVEGYITRGLQLENNHLGVKKFYDTGEFFVSGKVKIFKKKEIDFLNLDHTPNKIKKIIKQNKWKTTIGFQTRNIPHLGHEFIHRRMLDKYDGLIINPLVGERKKNDFTIKAIVKSYKTLINKFYPKKRILFFLLTTNMRFAGPREAIFHAIVRKNFGCTHFLIGRDHAGVDNFYGDYDAHKLAKKIDKKININIVKFKGPFFCKKCKIVTNEDNCLHFRDKKSVIQISGTKIRKSLKNKNFDNCRFLRKEVLNSIKKLKLFI